MFRFATPWLLALAPLVIAAAWTMARRRAMRRRPTASAMVATTGSPSGTAAMASAIPVSTMRPRDEP